MRKLRNTQLFLRQHWDGFALGCAVHEHAVPGAWPRPGEAGRAALVRAVRRIPDGAVVLNSLPAKQLLAPSSSLTPRSANRESDTTLSCTLLPVGQKTPTSSSPRDRGAAIAQLNRA